MPSVVHPMLAVPVEAPFDDPEWLFEIKWDGYRAVAFIENGKVRMVSRNQNDLTGAYPELHNLPHHIKAKQAIVDGEVVALDEQGCSSFSLMQQRTGIREGGRRKAGRDDISVVYYAFDLIYLDSYDLRRVSLEGRKRLLSEMLLTDSTIRYSDHFDQGIGLFQVAKEKGLEGILAKRRSSCYEERRSREWLKIKVTRTVDCVIGGYTDSEGSREFFGALVLGLYDEKRRLIHVGQAGTGFNHSSLKQMWQQLKKLDSSNNPFYGAVEARHAHWVQPELVAEIKFTEWTHETAETSPKLRAPVFLRLRDDKKPRECTFDQKALAEGESC